MEEIIVCSVCEEEKVVSQDDPELCQQCYDKIEGKNIMERARAYRCLVDSQSSCRNHKQREVGCALDLFFPEMPYSQRSKILRDLKE